jgi:haloalkane dehalogenase
MQNSGVTDGLSRQASGGSIPKGCVFVRQIPGEDPAFVLMYGFPDDHRIYGKLLPRLSPRRAVTFDFLGSGRSGQ